MSWFTDSGIEVDDSQVQNPNGVGQGTGVASPAQAQGGYDRQAFRDAIMSRPQNQSVQDVIAAHPEFSQGVQMIPGSTDKFVLPGTNERLDGTINQDAQGHGQGGWTDYSGQGNAQGGGGLAGIGSSSGSSGGGTNVALPTAPTYTPFQSDAPAIGQFAPTSTYGTSTPFTGVGNVPTPEHLTAQNLATPDKATYTNFERPPGFVAPTAAEAAADPGYQFALDQGKQLRQQDAASRGILQTGGFQKALEDYSQASGAQQYGNVYNRKLGESQLDYNQGFQTNQANNAGNLAVNQANAQTGLNYGQANNANTLAFGQANNSAAAAAQAAQYGQAANTYGVNQAGQAQQYGQQANTYAQNLAAQNQQYTQGFNTNQANNAGALNNYQAQVNAALGQGNLALGYQNSNNSYALGQGNLALGQGQLGLQTAGQNFNQGLALNQNAFNQNYSLASLGNPGAPNSQQYGVGQGDLYNQQGNVNAAGQVGSANAYAGALGNIGNAASQAAYMQWLQSQQPQGTA